MKNERIARLNKSSKNNSICDTRVSKKNIIEAHAQSCTWPNYWTTTRGSKRRSKLKYTPPPATGLLKPQTDNRFVRFWRILFFGSNSSKPRNTWKIKTPKRDKKWVNIFVRQLIFTQKNTSIVVYFMSKIKKEANWEAKSVDAPK